MARCNACGAEIRFLRTEKGRQMPVEPKPITVMTSLGKTIKAFVPHWTTCPGASQHRQKSTDGALSPRRLISVSSARVHPPSHHGREMDRWGGYDTGSSSAPPPFPSFGTRAESELKRGFSDETYRPVLLAVETAEGSEVEGQVRLADSRNGVESEDGKVREVKSTRKQKGATEKKELSVVAQQLVERGLTRSVAIALAENFPQEYLQEKMALHDTLKVAGELTQNAAGWLRSAIEEDYSFSLEQRKQMQAQAKRKAQEADRQALYKRAEALREQRIQEAMKHFPTQEEWISQHVEMRQHIRALMVERFGQTPLTDEDIQETRRSSLKNYPETDGEKLAHIRRHAQDYKADLKDIIEELKVEDSRNGVEDSRNGVEDSRNGAESQNTTP